MFTFADVYTDHATGQLTMFDRIVLKGICLDSFRSNALSCSFISREFC